MIFDEHVKIGTVWIHRLAVNVGTKYFALPEPKLKYATEFHGTVVRKHNANISLHVWHVDTSKVGLTLELSGGEAVRLERDVRPHCAPLVRARRVSRAQQPEKRRKPLAM
jgi:hypothetical protein